jgi:hypothetical protein
MNTQSENELLARLRQIVSHWPRTGRKLTALPRPYREMFAKDFDEGDLLIPVFGLTEVNQIRLSERSGEIEFFDSDGGLQRAVFERDEHSEWRLRSLRFQCPACFGTGKTDEDTCNLCDGAGWGTS